MNKSLSIILGVLLICVKVNSRVPQSVPFQGIGRDVHGVPIPNKFIALQLSIHDGSSGGTIIYQERDTVTTSNIGLFTVNVGLGIPVPGDTFNNINCGTNLII